MFDDIEEEITMTKNDNSINGILTRLRNNKAYKYVGITTRLKKETPMNP